MKKLTKRLLTITLAAALAASALFALSASATACPCHPRELGETLGYIHILNTGWEDATVLKSDGQIALIDAAEPGRGPYIVGYLQRLMGTEDVHLEFVIVSHSDIDHIGGFPYIFNHPNITVGRAYAMYERAPYAFAWYHSFIEAAENNGIELILHDLDERVFTLGHMTITNLNGAPFDPRGSMNAQSMVQLVEIGDWRTIIAADMNCRNAEAHIWQQMSRTADGQAPIDLLRAGHHGLHLSTGRVWANNLRPTYAVFTNGRSWQTQSHDVTLGNARGAALDGVGAYHNLRRVGTRQFVTTDNGGILAVFGTTGMELRAIGEFSYHTRWVDQNEWWHDDTITLTRIAPPNHNMFEHAVLWLQDHWQGLLRRWGV
ncbi:MAG: MBL fold metallo-hydrolase [Oscillospiraceae bacterium]|nr:MBL fold metallo-hydrolase [Oscillospiraceae bacterium]